MYIARRAFAVLVGEKESEGESAKGRRENGTS